ncbi:phosphatidylinositol 3-kinase, putative [Entamoeba invadens IP1]|uniref:Phosphatidylinositol 3-kinase, putative n=1 Tax=Entamoeba invadens IP1 TaxID=370355 RepID=A0A0A1UEJ1_ENTIV|nr:phosphatidylinositol 3-kinase, putative [Entamoeba invadens IP1]ELP91241.1 phosphatidylinositol 3-kinase, putative [Entamoeba invadens IP1]|eukprot:XP_004258012.1 phosphatidylinositol 3-kinase, putative [Entamoeba invadens IP1]
MAELKRSDYIIASPFRRTTWSGLPLAPLPKRIEVKPLSSGITPSPLSLLRKEDLDQVNDKKEPRPTNINVIVDENTVFVAVKDRNGKFYAYAMNTNDIGTSVIETCKSNVYIKGDYALTLPDLQYRVSDEDSRKPLKDLKFIQGCNFHGVVPYFFLVERKAVLQYQSVELVGDYLLQSTMKYDIIQNNFVELCRKFGEEFYKFRRSLAGVCGKEEEALSKFDKYLLEENEYVYCGNEPPIQDLNKRLMMKGFLLEQSMDKTISHMPTDTVENVISSLFTKFTITNKGAFAASEKAEDFVLKVRGLHEFLVPKKRDGTLYTLAEFDYIRRCVLKGEKIELYLKPRKMLHQFLGPLNPNDAKFDGVYNTLLSHNLWEKVETERTSQPQSSIDRNYFITLKKLTNCVYYKPLPQKKTKENKDEPPVQEYQNIVSFRAYVTAALFHGPRQLGKQFTTQVFQVNNGTVNLDIAIEFDLKISVLPKETKLVIGVFQTEEQIGTVVEHEKKEKSRDNPIGTINCKVVDHNSMLLMGSVQCGLWEMASPNFISMCSENVGDKAIYLTFTYPTYEVPIIMDAFNDDSVKSDKDIEKLTADQTKKFKIALESNPLQKLTEDETELIWKLRYTVKKTKPKNLSRVVAAVDLTNVHMVAELHRLIADWPLLDPQTAIEMLDFKFPDQKVRDFALKCLEPMDDAELIMFLPQLVQALKFELHHSSELAFFLLRRALRNKNRIGHQFFWFLKAELHDNRVTERYGLLLEAFVGCCGKYQLELLNEVNFQIALIDIANHVKLLATKDEQKQYLYEQLAKVKLPENQALPIDSRMRFTKPVPNSGNVFSSKKKPLLLILQNLDPAGEDLCVIQKVGDDLRQDILTLQILRIMYSMLKNAELDVRMLPYQCIATGNETGMLELVKNSETYGKIIADDGRRLAVTKSDVLTLWMQKQCSRPESKVSFEQAVDNFVHSCAGYCVATYLLGIGDRHSDNVMLTREGVFFHIDFGHFLGNFKSKFGVKRERTPFKFTTHFADLMGFKDGVESEHFKEFKELCSSALLSLRKQGSLFIYLFRLMLATGIPELRSEDDIEYMKNAFMFEADDQQVKSNFDAKIYECLDAWSQTLNDLIHDIVHYK